MLKFLSNTNLLSPIYCVFSTSSTSCFLSLAVYTLQVLKLQLANLFTFFTDSGEPTSYNEATQSEDFLDWQLATESEMNSIHANHTWDLVELPKNRKACRAGGSTVSSKPLIPLVPRTIPGYS